MMHATLEQQKVRIRSKWPDFLLNTEGSLPPLPLVHRTGSLDLFRSGSIATGASPTAAASALGAVAHAYFFVGVGAYPKGKYAILCESRFQTGTYTPFDTGAVARGVVVPTSHDGTHPVPGATEIIAAHIGSEADLDEFVSFYVKTHFNSAPKYLRSGQTSMPDRSPYHELGGGDRRSWTVEVQRTIDVDLSGEEVILVIAETPSDRDDLLDVLPPGSPLSSKVVALPEEGYGATFSERIASYVYQSSWAPREAPTHA